MLRCFGQQWTQYAKEQSIAGRPGAGPWVRVLALTRPGGTCHKPDPNFGFFTILFVHDEIYFVVNYSSSRVDVVCMCMCPPLLWIFTMG